MPLSLTLSVLASVRADDRFDVAVYHFGNYHLEPRKAGHLD